MTKLADLHVHTYLSDSTFSPEKVVELAKANGLDAIAITDHDICLGIEPAIKAGKDLGIEVIPGVELSAELNNDEIHILGYFIDWENKPFIEKLAEIVKVRDERAKAILKKLTEFGINISEDELFKLSVSGCVGRLHIARLLVQKGYVSSNKEAFAKYIGDKGPCYIKKFKLTPKQAIDIIKNVGGVAVLAHPKTICLSDITIEEVVKSLVSDGLQGIEVYHSDHKKKNEIEFKALAEKYNLLITGGSDCHGFGKKEVLIGRVKIPYELVEVLRRANV